MVFGLINFYRSLAQCQLCARGDVLNRYILTLWNSDFLKNVTDPYTYAGLNQSGLCYDKGWSHSLSLSVKRCWRKSKCFPNSCLILLNPSFMLKLYVMEKLTCLEHAPTSRKFIGECPPFDPWVYPISSHTMNESQKSKKRRKRPLRSLLPFI